MGLLAPMFCRETPKLVISVTFINIKKKKRLAKILSYKVGHERRHVLQFEARRSVYCNKHSLRSSFSYFETFVRVANVRRCIISLPWCPGTGTLKASCCAAVTESLCIILIAVLEL